MSCEQIKLLYRWHARRSDDGDNHNWTGISVDSSSGMAELGMRAKCVGGRWDHLESVPAGEGRIVLDVVRSIVVTTRRNMD